MFITINTFIYISGMQHNFEKQSEMRASTLGEPYDINSIMHYGKHAFALDGKFKFFKFKFSSIFSLGSIEGPKDVIELLW